MPRNALILSALLIAGCGQGDRSAPAPKQPKAVSAARVDRPVEDVLAKVPPQQRVAVQAALGCRIKANKGASLAITPDLIREVVDVLKTDPSAAKC